MRLPVVAIEPAVPAATAPRVAMRALDTVWIQLTGTLCNIACRHCFITCGPEETRVPMMSAAEVRKTLDDARSLGVREYYFTGGEPMMHPDFWTLCEETLQHGPLTVLTNGLLVDDEAAARAKRLFDASPYSFDLRVSLDGMTADENDPVRGKGTFERISAGLERLARAGFSPTITVVEHTVGMSGAAQRTAFFAFCRSRGLARPRLKFLPLLRIGREPRRTRDYGDEELDCLRTPLEPTVEERLVCATSRLVTSNGVYTCPILLDAKSARLGASLRDARGDIHLRWAACRTCVADGLSCNT